MSLEKVKSILSNYQIDAAYQKLVVYLSMEFAIDQSLKIYSGGLGYLAGSHMRSAYELKHNMIGVGILWTNGYYDQIFDAQGKMQVQFTPHEHAGLIDTEIILTVTIAKSPVKVKVWLLAPDTFHTVPVFLLSTDTPENDYLARTTTINLYDAEDLARIGASIVLGAGAKQLFDTLEIEPEIWHLNESHGLPVLYSLYEKYQNWEAVKQRTVFTTHTPELAGNESRPVHQLWDMSFFGNVPSNRVDEVSIVYNGLFKYTETAFKIAKRENAVSKLHAKVCQERLYGHLRGELDLIPITNAQNSAYWQDQVLKLALKSNDDAKLAERKKELKKELFKVVEAQTGKKFDPEVLTIVWARRFAGYKRAWLLLKDIERFHRLVLREKENIQVIWAGKPYPRSYYDIDQFHWIQDETRGLTRCAVLVGYELDLSAKLKKGSDIWLNTPRYLHEASGTSGMTAAMNGSINLSVDDGWVPEFAKHNENAFVIKHADESLSEQQRDEEEYQTMMALLENEIIPMYYNDPLQWTQIQKKAMLEVVEGFDSARMAREYYEKLYI